MRADFKSVLASSFYEISRHAISSAVSVGMFRLFFFRTACDVRPSCVVECKSEQKNLEFVGEFRDGIRIFAEWLAGPQEFPSVGASVPERKLGWLKWPYPSLLSCFISSSSSTRSSIRIHTTLAHPPPLTAPQIQPIYPQAEQTPLRG